MNKKETIQRFILNGWEAYHDLNTLNYDHKIIKY